MIAVQQESAIANRVKLTRIVILLSFLSLIASLSRAVWHWYGSQTGLGFIACCAAGMLVGRLSASAPTRESGAFCSRCSGAQLHEALNLLSGHNLEHAFCFSLAGKRFYLCARCSGAFVGSLVGAGLLVFITPVLSPVVTFSLAVPLLVDWTTQALGFRTSTNPLRFTTGVIAGLGLALLREVPGGLKAPQLAIIILASLSSVYLVSFFLKKKKAHLQ